MDKRHRAYGGRNNERDNVWWHGSVSGDMRGGKTGLHLGTKAAAEDALHASIGFPAEGEWDGTREYGKTLLAGKKTILKRNKYGLTGRNVNAPEEDHYAHEHPDGPLTYSNGDVVDPTSKPSIKPFRIVGKMTNSISNPHEDFKANGYMQAALKRGNAKNGYFYENVGEDSGSISAVVPNGSHVEPIQDDITKAGGGEVDDYRGQHEAPGPDSGAPLHDTTNVYPADFYGPKGFEYYANFGEDYDRKAYNTAARLKGDPEAPVWIHRAVPTAVYKAAMKTDAPLSQLIKKGDWVTPTKEYARDHGESVLNGDYKIASKRVKAKDVYTNGDSIHEWGYHPTVHKAGGGDVEPQRDLTPQGLYSQAAEYAGTLQPKATPQQYAATMRNRVPQAELEGFEQAFADQPSITREQVVQHFQSRMPQIEETVLGGPSKTQFTPDMEQRLNELTEKRISTGLSEAEMAEKNQLFRLQEEARTGTTLTKYHQYTIPGGENYREVLLKLLPEMRNVTLDEVNAERAKISSLLPPLTQAQYDALVNAGEVSKVAKNPNAAPFQSSHWNEPNVLAHLRMSDRTGPNGEKILHIEEIQSDWAQEGRRKGFKGQNEEKLQEAKQALLNAQRNVSNTFNRLESGGLSAMQAYMHPEYIAAYETEQRLLREFGDINSKTGNIPSAPYVTSTQGWTDLTLKRALKEAAEGGYDRIVWTPGAEQAKRYDLSKQIDRMAYDPEEKQFMFVPKQEGQWRSYPNRVEPNELENIIGKEAAQKLLETPPNKLSGIHNLESPDFVFGGEGMKGYYDKIVPTQLQKLIKKLDPEAKVGMTGVMLPPDPKSAKMGHNNPPIDAPGITITPTMRKNILKGMPHMATGGEVDDEPGFTAYHGSPHDFEQFDINKIGTGEGEQSYGHGLYFAGNEDVARNYRDKLSEGTYKTPEGEIFDPYTDLQHLNVKVAAYRNLDNAINRAMGLRQDQPEQADMLDQDLAKLQEMKAKNAQPHKGHMYEVHIAANPRRHFLDWDEPIYTPEVHEVAKELWGGEYPRATNGRRIYEKLMETMSPVEATKYLQSKGLRGITYLDAGSRDSKEDRTSNYVIFDHNHVKVRRKYRYGGGA